jgi:hypothetical protein
MKTHALEPNKLAPASAGNVLRRKHARESRQTGRLVQRHTATQSEPVFVPAIVPEVLRSPGQPLDATTREFMQPCFGHDFSQVSVHAPSFSANHGKLRENHSGRPKTIGLVGLSPDAGAPPQSARASSGGSKIPKLSLSGIDSYSDNGASHEKITYTVDVPTGANVKDYCLVQWTKGYAKKGDGKFFKSTDYGATRDWNYADWVIDSVDPDPIYWSNSASRWNYNVSGNQFAATDDPGPALSSEKGAIYAAQFKVAVYETAKVPLTTTGTISTTPVTAYEYWNYSVNVGTDGKFTHPKI